MPAPVRTRNATSDFPPVTQGHRAPCTPWKHGASAAQRPRSTVGTGNQDEAAGLARRVLAQGGARSHASRPQPLMGTPRSVCSAVGVTWRPASTPTKSDSVNPRGASGRDARRPRGGWLINRTENTAPKPVLSSAAAPPGRGEPGTRRCLRTRLHKADFCKTLGKRVPRVRTRLSSSQSSYIQPTPLLPPRPSAARPLCSVCTGQRRHREKREGDGRAEKRSREGRPWSPPQGLQEAAF